MYNQAGFTLFGIYNFFENSEENTPLFNNIELYSGGVVYSNEFEDGYTIPAINKADLIEEIIEECGDLLTIRQNPFRFKRMVEQFFSTNKHNFDRIWISLNMDYSPIDNYDRHEYINNEYDSLMTNTDSKKIKEHTEFTPTGSEVTTIAFAGGEKTKNTTDTNQTITEEISAENSGSYQPDKKTTTSPEETTSETTFQNRKDESQLSYQNRKDDTTTIREILDGDSKDKHSGNDYTTIWAHGNVGVKETSEIVKNEIELRKFNFYSYIAELFSQKLLLEIY